MLQLSFTLHLVISMCDCTFVSDHAHASSTNCISCIGMSNTVIVGRFSFRTALNSSGLKFAWIKEHHDWLTCQHVGSKCFSIEHKVHRVHNQCIHKNCNDDGKTFNEKILWIGVSIDGGTNPMHWEKSINRSSANRWHTKHNVWDDKPVESRSLANEISNRKKNVPLSRYLNTVQF